MQATISRRDFLKLLPLGLSSLGAFSPLGVLAEDWLRPPGFPIGPESLDVLTKAQRKALLQASLHFLAPDGASANRVALEIDFIEGLNEHASNMCGPLLNRWMACCCLTVPQTPTTIALSSLSSAIWIKPARPPSAALPKPPN